MSKFTELYSDTCPQMKVYPAHEVDKRIEELETLLKKWEENYCLRGEIQEHGEKVGRITYTVAVKRAMGIVSQMEQRIKHTSHRDGLGMGSQCCEKTCRDIIELLKGIK